MRKQKRRTPRPVRIPVTRSLRDEFAMHLYLGLVGLQQDPPEPGAFDCVAGIINAVQVALADDARHSAQARVITGGAAAMNKAAPKISAGAPLSQYELLPIQAAVQTIDNLLGRLDVTRLHNAIETVRALTRGRPCESSAELPASP